MDGHLPDAVVTGHEAVAANRALPDPDDRHALMAAIHGRTDIIVTRILREFPVGQLAPTGLSRSIPTPSSPSCTRRTPRRYSRPFAVAGGAAQSTPVGRR